MLPTIRSTQIGSLPHHNVDSALAYSFGHDVVFLPQIPIARPEEFMIQQSIAKLPGMIVSDKMEAQVDLKDWLVGKDAFNKRIHEALESEKLEEFLPDPDTMSCWKPFLFEIEEREIKTVKVQLAGPFTTQLVTKLSDGKDLNDLHELQSQILKVIMARSLAMVKELKSTGVREIIMFIDEPALYFLKESGSKYIALLHDLKLLLLALKKEGVKTGIHCCSNTSWEHVLSLPIHYLSIDTELSLENLLMRQDQLREFVKNGGRLSLGIVPTDKKSQVQKQSSALSALALIKRTLGEALLDLLLDDLLLTPACGLAYKTTTEAEMIKSFLNSESQKLNNISSRDVN